MESPFRNIASISDVASGAEDVSRALLDLIEPLKDPPAQFRHLATNIGQCACLLACTVHLIHQHPAIFKKDLASLVSDVNGHFGIIQETVKRWIRSPRGRWRRMKWLYWSGRIADFIRRLQALMSCLDVLVGVATIAIDKSEEVAIWQLILHRSQALRSIEEARFQTAHLHRSHAEREPVVEVPRPYRGLLTLGESSRDVAEWMSTVLSAPSVPLKGAAGGPPPQGIIKYERSRYAFSPTTRPNPDFDAESSRLIFTHDSICLAALSRLGLQYTIEDSEEDGGIGRKVVVQIDKSMKDFEVDLIISTSQVMQALPSPEWKPSTSPWMRLPPEEALTRLLKSCTVLSDEDIESVILATTPPLMTAIRENGDTADETGTSLDRLRLVPDLEGEEFSRDEFERSESLRDWVVHPPVQADPQRVVNTKWDSRSRISDGNIAIQAHTYPMMPAQPNQLMLPAPPMPTLHESPPVGRRVSYPLGMDPAWIQDFQERIDLREKVKDLEQKLQYSKDEARVSVMELENKLEDSKRAELDLATRLAQEHETQIRFETELKNTSLERAQLEASHEEAKAKVDDMTASIKEYTEEITRLKAEISALELVSTQVQKSESAQRGMNSYREEIEKWKLEMMEQQAKREQQCQIVSDREVAKLREFVTRELSEIRTKAGDQAKLRLAQEKQAAEQKLAGLEQEKRAVEQKLAGLEQEKQANISKIEALEQERQANVSKIGALEQERQANISKVEALEQRKEVDVSTIEALRDKTNSIQKRHEEEVRDLADKIKKLKKKKTKAQLELQWLKDTQKERIQAEKEAARAAAILEFRENLHQSAKEAVQKEMDVAAERQADIDAAKQNQEAVPEAVVDSEVIASRKDPSVVSSSRVDVMSFVVEDDADGVDWPDNKTETTDGAKASESEFPQDNIQAAHDMDSENADNNTADEEPRPHEGTSKSPPPNVEDFLVAGTEDDSGYKSILMAVSRPWKGMGDIEPPAFEGICPLYIRGNGMGQTLYYGANPIHVRELSESYQPNGDQQYLTVSKFYLDPQVLEQFGIDYVELDDGYLSLDPAVSTFEIEKLFHQSYVYREIEAFKGLKKGYKTSVGNQDEEGEEQEKDYEEEEDEEGNDDDAEQEARAVAGTCRAS